jgi:hypothetical protein
MYEYKPEFDRQLAGRGVGLLEREGPLGYLAAGTYTDIVSIDAPSSAEAGETVNVTVKIKNTYSSTISVACIAVRDTEDRFIDWEYYNIPAGSTHSFTGSFIMPSSSCTIHVYSYWYGADSVWHSDDEDSKNVSLAPSWVQIASKTLSISPAEQPSVWVPVASKTLSISPAEQPSVWVSVASKNLTISPTQEVEEWVKVAEKSLSITPGEVPEGEWAQVAEETLVVEPGFEIPEGYDLVDEKIYDAGKTYSGPAQRCVATFTFLPADWPGTKWFIDKLFSGKISSKLTEEGATPLTYRLYEKGFSYYIVIEATVPAEGGVGRAARAYVAAFPWAAVIVGALILAIVITIAVTIIKTEDFLYNAPEAAKEITKWGWIALGIASVVVIGIAISQSGKKKPKKPAAKVA